MAGVKGKSGGVRPNSGRKPKADEVALIEKLSPLDDIAFKELTNGVKSGDFQYLKLFMEYRFGKPKQAIEGDIDSNLNITIKRANGC
jgi:hypothetical protein